MMRYNKAILPIVLALCVFPMTFARTAAAADQPGAQGFRILLSDGSVLKGAVSFTLSIDTQYGQLTVPSTDFVSARFNSTGGWADIRTQAIQLRVQYKPESSQLKAMTEVGPVNVDLTKVVSVESLYAEAPNAAPPVTYGEASQPAVADVYSQPATLVDLTPYEYGAPAPYYWPSYFPPEPCCFANGFPCESPCFPFFGFALITDFDRDHHRDHERFEGRLEERHEDRFDGGFEHHGSGTIWNGTHAWHSDPAPVQHFNGTVGKSPVTSGWTFSSPIFHRMSTPSFSAPVAPTFRSGGTMTFHSSVAPSFGSGGTHFSSGGGSWHSSGFGGFSHSSGFGGFSRGARGR